MCIIMRRKTQETFVKEVFDMYGNEYSVLGEYKTAKTPIEIKHNVCGNIFKITPSNFLCGRQCPLHKNDRITKHNITPLKTIKKQLHNLVGNEYTIDNYTMVSKKATFTHNICGNEFEMIVDNFINGGSRCPKCSSKNAGEKKRKSPEQFKKEFYELANDEYELLSEYSTCNNKIKIKHKKCGTIYWATPNAYLNGTRCPNKNCITEKIVSKIAKDDETFKKEIEEKYYGEYIPLDEYTRAINKIRFLHIKCRKISLHTPHFALNKNTIGLCKYCDIPTKGEKRIIDFLDANHISYKFQHMYDDLFGTGGKLLSYDFYLPNYNLLIEYQGEFHDVTAYKQTNEELKKQQEHDRRKREYAKSHNIELLEIWYWDFDNIEKILQDSLEDIVVK